MIHSRKKEAVLWASFIEISEVNTHLPRPFRLKYQYRIGQLDGIEGFPEEPNTHKLAHFRLDYFGHYGIQGPPILADTSGGWINVESMTGHVRIYAAHICLAPG